MTVEDALARNETVLPDYSFVPGRFCGRDRSRAPQPGGQLPDRWSGAFLPGRAGRARDSRRRWLDLRPFVHAAPLRGSAYLRPGAWLSRTHWSLCEIRRMGGGFGGKESQASTWAAMAALAARVTGGRARSGSIATTT